MKTTPPPASRAPDWWQTIRWVTNPLEFLDSVAPAQRDIFSAPARNFPRVFLVSHPQALQQIFSNDKQKFCVSPNRWMQPAVGDYSIFVLDGDRHRRMRKLLLPPFHGDRMRTYGETICTQADAAFHQMRPGESFVARTVMQTISLDIILRAVFGMSEGERFQQLKQLIPALLDTFQSPLTSGALFFPGLRKDWSRWSPWGRFCHLRRQIDRLIYGEICDRKTHYDPNRTDILNLLIGARDEAGQSMTNEELHDELMTLLMAGHETTATAIAWAMYWIHRTPAVRERLLAELNDLDHFDPIHIAKLPYLSAVCNESLRIYPVVIMTGPRAVKEPVELLGYPLEAGTGLYGCIYLTHRRPDLYPEPEQFRPERFLKRQFSPYEFLPFGGGVRRCIGEALALFEMKLVLATMLSRCQLALADRKPERPQRRAVTLAPGNGVRMVFQGMRSKE